MNLQKITREDRNLNKKFRKLSLEKEQNNFNNKLIKSFQSIEVKELYHHFLTILYQEKLL